MKRTAGLVLVIGAMIGVARPAAAQESVEPVDAATGYDHVGDPPPGALSSADWCFSFADPALIGQTITVTADGPSGPVGGEGVVGDDGRVLVPVGITEGGDYAVTSIRTADGRSVSNEGVESVTVVFDPERVDCLDGLALPPPPTTAPASSTTSSTSTTSTTIAGVPVGGGDDGSNLPLVLLVVGVLLVFLGGFISYFPGVTVGATTTRCEKERRALAWTKAEVEKAEAAEASARRRSAELKAEIERVRFDRKLPPQKREETERALMKERSDVDASVGEHHAHVRTMKEEVIKAQRALDACLAKPTGGADGDPGGTAAGGSTSHSSTSPAHPDCCPAGNWIGINVYLGGIFAVAGREAGVVTLVCMEDPERMAVIKWSGTRFGLGLGGEASAGLFLVMNGGVHPYELPPTVAGIVGGYDFDVSVGVSWTKLAKGMGKAGVSAKRWKELKEAVEKARDAAKALAKARKSGTIEEATKIATKNADVLKRLVRDGVADDVAEVATKSGMSAKQADGKGVNIPYGKGMQLGGWKLVWVKAELFDLDGCKNCDPSK